jgi:hypothetical protein
LPIGLGFGQATEPIFLGRESLGIGIGQAGLGLDFCLSQQTGSLLLGLMGTAVGLVEAGAGGGFSLVELALASLGGLFILGRPGSKGSPLGLIETAFALFLGRCRLGVGLGQTQPGSLLGLGQDAHAVLLGLLSDAPGLNLTPAAGHGGRPFGGLALGPLELLEIVLVHRRTLR